MVALAGGVRLRVSDDYNMAIEDSDLSQRQPKHFFLTTALMTQANQALTNAGSLVRLAQSGGQIRILTGWWGTKILDRVTAVLASTASPDTLPQNCNLIAESVTGRQNMEQRGMGAVSAAKTALLGNGDDLTEREVEDYVKRFRDAGTRWNFSGVSANQFANPDIGESYMIVTLSPSDEYDEYIRLSENFNRHSEVERTRYRALEARLTDILALRNGGAATVRDYESGLDRVLNWSYHFAGVVARSGGDSVTLENYARGDNRQGNPDPRWYFQMYSQTNSGQSFHEAHKAQNAYANPLTVKV